MEPFPTALTDDIDRQIKNISDIAARIITDIPVRFNEFIEQERERFDRTIGELRGNFSKSTIELQEQITTAKLQVGGLKETYESELEKANKLFAESKSSLEQMEKSIEEFAGVITNKGLIIDYAVRADEDRKIANFYQWLTILAMCGIGAYAFYTANQVISGHISLGQSGIRATMLAFMGAIPAYLAKIASRHRNYQYHFKQTALDISALSPYLSQVEKKQDAQRVLLEMAPKLFTRHAQQPGHSDQDFGARDLLLKLLDKFPNKT